MNAFNPDSRLSSVEMIEETKESDPLFSDSEVYKPSALKPKKIASVAKISYIDSLAFIVPSLFGASVGLATVFYTIWHKWQLSTSLFYAIQVLAGAMYGIPEESDSVSQVVTMMLYIWGVSIISGSLIVYVTAVVEAAIKNSRKNGLYTGLSPSESGKDLAEKGVESTHNKTTVIIFTATFLWIVVGIFYGIVYEKHTLTEALFSSVAAISASGTRAPSCEPSADGCQLGDIRGYFMSLYLFFGVPLFSLAVGQFSGLAVDRAVRSSEIQKMRQAMSEKDFEFACSFHAGDGDGDKSKITFSEFFLTELYRLDRVDSDELNEMRALFNSFDVNGDGFVDKDELLSVTNVNKDSNDK
jgi:hypothetical protein